MFSNLDDQIQKISGHPDSRIQQLLGVLGVVVVTALLFGSLLFGISILE